LFAWPMSTTFVLLGGSAVIVGLSARTLREFDKFDIERAG